jgi:DNA transformation protein and related proteins
MGGMAARSDLLDDLIDRLGPLGHVSGRAMFGGHGLYLDGTIVGIVIDELLYLKVDDANREDYLAAGATPFTYQGRDRLVTTSYWEAPADIFDDDDTLRRWIAAAHGAARRAHRPAKRARR